MKILEYNHCMYNLEKAESISFLGAFENEFRITFSNGKKLGFRCAIEFPVEMADIITFIKDPEATYYKLSGLDWYNI